MAQAAQQQLDIEELRLQISQALSSHAAFSEAVYHDQPIIMTGCQLKSFVPEPIRQARALARTQTTQRLSSAKIFYHQACLLADYEDDYNFAGTFSRYYPTYEAMSNSELRGYFAWRTKVRHGTIERDSLSFAYLYLYELIHLVGVESPQAGFEAMRAFGNQYGRFDARFARTYQRWLKDFVIYYGLDPNLLCPQGPACYEQAFCVLEEGVSQPDEVLFEALLQLGAYDMPSSYFFIEHEAQVRQLVVHVYRYAWAHHDTKLKTSLISKLLGRQKIVQYQPFERAVFANPLGTQQQKYAINKHDIIRCHRGVWVREYYPNLAGPLTWVTHLLESCESILRDAYDYPNVLECSLPAQYLIKEAKTYARSLVEATRARKARAVHIDFGQLDSIRQAANITCEKLIVEEAEEGQGQLIWESCTLPSFGTAVSAQPVAASDQSVAALGSDGAGLSVPSREPREGAGPELYPEQREDPTSESLLEPLEVALISYLFSGKPLSEFEQEHHCIASVLIDSINEKLYDLFADICIDAASDNPVIIEDYAQDLQALCK